MKMINKVCLGLLFSWFNMQSAFAASEATVVDSVVSGGELLRIALGLLAVIALIILLSWIIKRINHSGLKLGGQFEIIGAMTLGAREKLLLVKVGERYLLLGLAQSSINLLHDFGETMPAGFQAGGATFGSFFKKAVGDPNNVNFKS